MKYEQRPKWYQWQPIALTWFMWSGKSTIWKGLASELRATFTDLDDETLKLLGGKSIPDYIEEKDDWVAPYTNFRWKETQALDTSANMFDKKIGNIVALGGWTLDEPQYDRNLKILRNSNALVIYIQTDIEKILQYKSHDVVWEKKRKQMTESEFRQLYQKRDPLYMNASDIIISNTWDIEEAVKDILHESWLLSRLSQNRAKIDEIDDQLIYFIGEDYKLIDQDYNSVISHSDFTWMFAQRNKWVSAIWSLKKEFSKDVIDPKRRHLVREKWVWGLWEWGWKFYDQLHDQAVILEQWATLSAIEK